jgi:hypothetical protein
MRKRKTEIPKTGSRAKLTELFIQRMSDAFDEHGPEIIERCRRDNPAAYIACISKLIPQQIEVGEAGVFSEMTDDELDAYIADATVRLGPIKPAGNA